jgi:cyanate permease
MMMILGGKSPFFNAKIDYLKNRKCLLKPIDWEVKIWSGLVSIAIWFTKTTLFGWFFKIIMTQGLEAYARRIFDQREWFYG